VYHGLPCAADSRLLIIFLHQWPKRRPLFALDMKVVYVALWLRTVGQVIVFIYTPARLVLIVLAFYDLAWLTPGAHRTVEWTSFVPHIGCWYEQETQIPDVKSHENHMVDDNVAIARHFTTF
jgi:hypothetical protein